jgi:PAS domain S-box-containing protein
MMHLTETAMGETRGPHGDAMVPTGTLHRLLVTASDGVFVTTEDNRIVFWNRAAETMMGYRARDAVGRPCAEVFAGRGPRGTARCVTGCDVAPILIVNGFDQIFDMQTRTKTGDARWLNITAFAVTDGHGGGPFVVHVLRDVTSSKDLQRLVHERVTRAPHAGGPSSPGGALTARELEVLRLMATGIGTAASAERLRVSRATIRNHVQNIFGKLGVHTRLEAVAHATRHRLL